MWDDYAINALCKPQQTFRAYWIKNQIRVSQPSEKLKLASAKVDSTLNTKAAKGGHHPHPTPPVIENFRLN